MNIGFILFIVADIFLLIFLLVWLVRYQNKKVRSRTLKEFEHFVTTNNLKIDTVQTLNKNIIGLDREKMILLFLDRKNKINPVQTIQLEEIVSCKAIKSRKTDNGHIRSISLEIMFKDYDKERVVLPFYHENNDPFYKMMRLAKKAYYWEKRINLFSHIAEVV